MLTNKKLVEKYDQSDPEERVNIICKNYMNFIGIIDGCIAKLCHQIICDKEFSVRRDCNELGVRIQRLGGYSDPTCREAMSSEDKAAIRAAIISCNFTGNILHGVEDEAKIRYVAGVLYTMRQEYELFNIQLKSLGSDEKDLFIKYLTKKKGLEDIAEEQGINYSSAIQKIRRIKYRLKLEMLDANL